MHIQVLVHITISLTRGVPIVYCSPVYGAKCHSLSFSLHWISLWNPKQSINISMYVYIDISHKTCRSLHCTQTYLLKLHYESLCRSLSLIAYLSSLFIHLYTENDESIRIRTHTNIDEVSLLGRCIIVQLFVRLFARSWSTFWFTLHCFSNGFIHILPSITFALSHFSSFIYASMHLCVHS